MSIYTRFNEAEQAAFQEGVTEGRKFRARHGDINQDLFKAETDTHRIYVGYDDVEYGIFLDVTFKERFDQDGNAKTITVGRSTYPSAMARALAFLARHPHHKPYCDIDY